MHTFVGVQGGLDVGTLPAPSPTAAVEAGLGVPWIEGRVRATFLFPQPALAAALPGAGADISALVLDVRGCVRPFEGFRNLGGCLGLGGKVMFGQGFGVSAPQLGVAFRAEAAAGLLLAWRPVRWFDLELDVQLVVPLGDVDFAIRAPGGELPVHTTSPVAGRFGLSGHVQF